MFLGAVPGYAALSEEYAWERTSKAETQRRSKSRWAWLDTTTRWRTRVGRWIDEKRRRGTLGVGGRVLDIGCGGGCRVPEGPVPYGIEISKALAARAEPSYAKRGGAVVHASAVDGLDAFEPGFFTAILMRSYLEHESQPRLVLEKAFRCLAPDGQIYVRVPDFGSLNRRIMGSRWCGFRFPDHVNYFTGRSLRRLAESIGFRYVRSNRLSLFDDNIIAVLKKPRGV